MDRRTSASVCAVIIIAAIAFVLLAVALVIALQIPQIADLFSQRAKLVQDYDGARLGRFARHWLGFLMADRSIRLASARWSSVRSFGEDTHNMWLKALLDYSWLGFAAWLTLMVLTLGLGFKILFRPRYWQPYLICAYSVFVSHMVIGNIIDIDHWRHFYLVIGIIWGCVGLEYRHSFGLRAATPQTAV